MLLFDGVVYNSGMASLTYKFHLVLVIFGFSFQVLGEDALAWKLNDEMEFLKDEATDVDVYIPESKNQKKLVWFAPDTKEQTLEDSVSVGLSALKKETINNKEEIDQLLREVEEIPHEFPTFKKRRIRSR